MSYFLNHPGFPISVAESARRAVRVHHAHIGGEGFDVAVILLAVFLQGMARQSALAPGLIEGMPKQVTFLNRICLSSVAITSTMV
jgi:hypothetical protein